MKKIILLFACLAMLCACQAGSNNSKQTDGQQEVADNEEAYMDEAVDASADGDLLQVEDADAPEAPDFTLTDLNGKPFKLSSLRGKYVILDFWGSWCYWCMKGMPEMKKYYAKYAGKLEILGVNCGDTEAKWKAAVVKHDLLWLHVYCPDDNAVLTTYDIQGFPTKILISPNGKIINSVCGEDKSFYQCLDEIFSQK